MSSSYIPLFVFFLHLFVHPCLVSSQSNYVALQGSVSLHAWGWIPTNQSTQYPRGLSRQAQAYQVGVLGGCAFVDFTVPVSIGTPAQSVMQLIVDTGSSTMAVASTACTNCAGVFPEYNATLSNSSVPFQTSVTASSTYADGSGWSGKIFYDQMRVGSSPFLNVSFVAMTSQAGFFTTQTCQLSMVNPTSNLNQGIAGMAYPRYDANNNPNLPSFMDSWTKYTGLPNKFAIQLCMTTGNLWLGGYDPAYFQSSLTYIPIQPQGGVYGLYNVFWTKLSMSTQAAPTTFTALNFTAATLGGQCADAQPTCTIVDSGSSLFQMPMAAYSSVVNNIVSSSQFQTYFPNSNGNNYFDLGLCVTPASAVSDATLNSVIPAMELTLSASSRSNVSTDVTLPLLPVNSYLVPVSISGTIYYCPGINGYPAGGYDSILGWSVMNQFVIDFDRGASPPRIGFAPVVRSKCAVNDIPSIVVASSSSLPSSTFSSTGLSASVSPSAFSSSVSSSSSALGGTGTSISSISSSSGTPVSSATSSSSFSFSFPSSNTNSPTSILQLFSSSSLFYPINNTSTDSSSSLSSNTVIALSVLGSIIFISLTVLVFYACCKATNAAVIKFSRL